MQSQRRARCNQPKNVFRGWWGTRLGRDPGRGKGIRGNRPGGIKNAKNSFFWMRDRVKGCLGNTA